MSLLPVRKADIVIGRPLPWAVFDANGVLLFNVGQIIVSENQVELLQEKGMFREVARSASRAAGTIAEGGTGGGAEPAKGTGQAIAFDEINVKPGDVLQLQPLLDGAAERYHVRVIGYMRPTSIICTAPRLDDRLVFVRDGQPFLVRCFIGKDASAFKTKVLKTQMSPFPYLHLGYPDSVQSMRIRKAVRVPVALIAAIQERESTVEQFTGTIVDLSLAGARIHTPRPMVAQGEAVDLAFRIKLLEVEEDIRTPVIVRSVTEDNDPDTGEIHIATGVEFESLEPMHRLFIMNLIYQNAFKDAL